MRVVDARHILLDLSEFPRPFPIRVRRGDAIGMIVIDFSTRRRMRANGRIAETRADRYVVHFGVHPTDPIRAITVDIEETALAAPGISAPYDLLNTEESAAV